MKALEVHNLRKEFVRREAAARRRVPALGGVSFDVERGECVAILGQNGSGKSTLVRLLSTLLLPDGGSAIVFGHDVVRDTRAVRRLVNRVSVEALVLQEDVGGREPELRGALLRPAAAQTRDRSPRSSTRVGFPADRRAEPMENLSRGMQQKVALARALLTSPMLLLLDEPTTGLDPRSKLEVQEFIREVRAEHDATILLCTHDLAEAECLADRVGILDGGALLCLEPADGAEGPLRRRDARGGVLRRDRPLVRERRRRGATHEQRMSLALRHELVGLGGVVERNVYLVKRYIWWDLAFFLWTVANTLTIVFIAKGIPAVGGTSTSTALTTVLLVGAVIWAYLGIIFEILTETVAWERWEGTIEYTFMAPLSRPVHLLGMGLFAIVYGVVRAVAALRRRRGVLRAAPAERELRRGARAADRRLDLVHRDRDDDRGPAADLAGEGHAARLRRAGPAARRLGRLLPGLGAAGLDAVAGDDLAGDLRAARLPRRRSSRAPASARSGPTSGRCS